MLPYQVRLTYFKENGTYYSSSSYEAESNLLSMYQIFDDVERKAKAGKLPGLEPSRWVFHILVEVPGHPNNHPKLILHNQ